LWVASARADLKMQRGNVEIPFQFCMQDLGRGVDGFLRSLASWLAVD